MKSIAIILAIQLFLLAIVPCIDRDVCGDEKDGPAVKASVLHNHLRSERDICSPFCLSTCCTPHFASHPIAIVDFSTSPSGTGMVTPRDEGVLPARANTIWQPPRS